ncbi:MAG: 3-hydroxybutyryl-CoA dehydrogenase [Paracoccaceae bacterium]|nr:MAG: 3-hydroxybutyryl-CoA dehydrogenase [Paracoccaceae bacterium]
MDIVGVVGLGAMGLGIAQVFLAAGHRVVATDAMAAARDSAAARLEADLARRVAAGRLGADSALEMIGRLAVLPDAAGLAGTRLVIEAVIEDLAVKRALFGMLEGVAPQAVLATNTSSLSVGAVAAGLERPGRVVGLHFFNPAPAMKLVELIAHAGSDAAALALARRLAEGAGKTVIACADRPGFIVNRCARPYYGEALAMLEAGRVPGEIDAAMVAAGYRLGPFALIDLIGADVNLAATEGVWAAMGRNPRYHPFEALRAQVAAGRLGRKSGTGFVTGAMPVEPPPDAADIVLRIEATLANEAAYLLAEGGVDAAGIDTALRLGLNFPRGALAAAQAQGWDRIRDTLAALAAAAPAHLAGRYDPAPGLGTMGDRTI